LKFPIRHSPFFLSSALLLFARCAAGPAPSGLTPPRPTAAQTAARFSSPLEAQAELLWLEDRRAFDPAILSAAAHDPEAGTRARAGLTVGRIGDDRGAALLRELLADRSADVRTAAAFGCQVFGDPSLTGDLIPLLADADLRVAAAAARAIGTLGRGDGQDALLAAVPSAASAEARAAMLAALWKFPNFATQAAALRYAADPDPRVRAAAIYTLARKPLEGSLPALTAALRDTDPDTAAIAARGLGVLEKMDALAPLAEVLDSGKTPLVISSLVAMEAILEKNPGASLPEERKSRILALAGDANGNVAAPALVLLRQFVATEHGRDRSVFSRLWSIAATGEGRRRQAALLSVVAVLKANARTALDAAATSNEAPLRATAAESLAFLPDADARPWRQSLAADKSALVRLGVLAGLRSSEAVRQNREIVHSALTDPDPGVRAAAVDALGLTNDPSILPLLQEAADKSASDAGADVAVAVIGVCEKLRAEPPARVVVESLYRQRKTLVARLARRCLLLLFRADPAAFPAPEYSTGKSPADYAALLAEARKPWLATVETARGSFTIRLAGEAAPMTVMNFVELAGKKFFDGVDIHRVVPNFVLQDGDPTGTGNGGPGYEIRDELNPLEYVRGAVGMALAGPDTGGSQWFVTHSPQPHLNGNYTVFGQVSSGQDVIERIEQWDRIARVTVAANP
jgi:cyclophilin family peptidyl-prolyl cis-trans isomerase/HEAT repeat protein